MKVILAAVNAKYIHSNLAVFSLRAYAAQHGQEAEIAEYTINHQPEHILMDLYKRKPDVLAFSCYIWNFEMILELAEEVACQLDSQVFPTKIRRGVGVAMAPAHGQSVLTYRPASKPALDLQSIVSIVAGDRFPLPEKS